MELLQEANIAGLSAEQFTTATTVLAEDRECEIPAGTISGMVVFVTKLHRTHSRWERYWDAWVCSRATAKWSFDVREVRLGEVP